MKAASIQVMTSLPFRDKPGAMCLPSPPESGLLPALGQGKPVKSHPHKWKRNAPCGPVQGHTWCLLV